MWAVVVVLRHVGCFVGVRPCGLSVLLVLHHVGCL